ncbi:RNA polymerase sigma factor [Parabacteroides sp. FAFU027]|uniref:RNA polymerase sigma factor n=1 Tax=Parabacteroides sp. FAFU027 TaxID=2922715 RepID=UPI001FAF38B8|nr:sigma-70 family RNA polymerase sigma factor [Parabacteroides sp. FAFU027]
MDIDKTQLVKEFGLSVSRLAHRMIHNQELAKEAAQEVWVEIIRSIGSFQGNSEISTWIYSVAKRTILRYAEAERTYTTMEINNHFELEPIDCDGAEGEKRQWVKEKCDYCLTAFCHCLNNDARLIFLFREIAGLHYEQIGHIMNLKEENIRQILTRSREKVRHFMNNNCVIYNPQGNCKCRIRKHVMAVDLDKEYNNLSKAAELVAFYQKFDKELPQKNYWEKIISEVVTE